MRQGLGPMQDGEEVVLEVEKIGKLMVHVSDPLKRKWPFEVDSERARRIRESSGQGQGPRQAPGQAAR